MTDFVHLHVHSHYSLLDGISKAGEIIKKTASYGQRAVALTDHGNLFGMMDFHLSAEKHNQSVLTKIKELEEKGQDASLLHSVKPIYGFEAYLSPVSRFERPKENRKNYHLVLLAENLTGYKNLIRLSSAGYTEGFYYKPRIDRGLLQEHSEGIIALSACLSGEIASKILEENENELHRAVDFYVDTFGKDRFFLEIQDHGLHEQKKVNERMLSLSQETGLGLVATNDAHYISRADAELQEIMFCVRDKDVMSNENRFKYDSREFYLKSPEEMEKLFGNVPESLSNTVKIAEMCQADLGQIIQKNRTDHTPKYPLAKNETPDSKLRQMCLDRLKKRFAELENTDEIPSDYLARLNLELNVIGTMGFSNYFLVVQDFVFWARSKGILVGPGRGSAAGALVAYSLGITNIDPMKYDLLFERFLNPDRVSMPDIDIDFQDNRRDEVKEYIRSHYGYEFTADVITFGLLKARNALKDVGRALEIPLEKVNATTKLIDNKLANKDFDVLYEEIPELKKLKEKSTGLEKSWLEYAERLTGTIRQTGVHASALIISDAVLTDVVPLFRDSRGENPATQYDGHYLEDNGLLKMDILGLSNLSMIQDCLLRIWRNHLSRIDIDRLDLSDEKVYRLIQSGDTSGVFQLESDGMKAMLRKMKPSNFEDVIAALALYRPGPLGSGMVDEYIERKHGRKEIEYPHPSLESVLKNTYGIIVYQEQVMQIGQVVGGFSLGGADLLRRAVAKKKEDEMAERKIAFAKGAAEKDVPKETADYIFGLIEEFAKYGFNKSHSAAYALITFITAYLKTYYRSEFMASLMTLKMDDSDSVKLYAVEAKMAGLAVHLPDINQSKWEFSEDKNTILFGFGGIKGLGEGVTDLILEERGRGGHFSSFRDFLDRMLPKSSFQKSSAELLLQAGAFDRLITEETQGNMNDFLKEKAILLRNLDSLMGQIEKNKKEEQLGFMGLFGEAEDNGFEVRLNENVKPLSLREEFENERKAFGFYLSGAIFEQIKNQFGDISRFSSDFVNFLKTETPVTLIGYLSEVQIKEGKRGNPFAILTFETALDSYRFFLFGENYTRNEVFLKPFEFLVLRGKISDGRNGTELTVESFLPMNGLKSTTFSTLNIFVENPDSLSPFENLKTVLTDNRGICRVNFHIFKDNSPHCLQAGSQMTVRYSHELFDHLLKTESVRGFWLS